jgi:hypothetical protein
MEPSSGHASTVHRSMNNCMMTQILPVNLIRTETLICLIVLTMLSK